MAIFLFRIFANWLGSLGGPLLEKFSYACYFRCCLQYVSERFLNLLYFYHIASISFLVLELCWTEILALFPFKQLQPFAISNMLLEEV